MSETQPLTLGGRYCPACGYDQIGRMTGDETETLCCSECGTRTPRKALLVFPPPHPVVRAMQDALDVILRTAAVVMVLYVVLAVVMLVLFLIADAIEVLTR
jgi:hypothetical protein